MNFETEEEYNYYIQAQGEAESAAEERCQYEQYLYSLIKDGKYKLHAIEIVQDLISQKYNAELGVDINAFLSIEKAKLIFNESNKKQNEKDNQKRPYFSVFRS